MKLGKSYYKWKRENNWNISIDNVFIFHINEAQRLKLTWEQYIDYLNYKDKKEDQIESDN